MAGRPSFHFRVLGPPGCAGVLAGSFLAVGNFLITTAVELGGNAVRDEPSACIPQLHPHAFSRISHELARAGDHGAITLGHNHYIRPPGNLLLR